MSRRWRETTPQPKPAKYGKNRCGNSRNYLPLEKLWNTFQISVVDDLATATFWYLSVAPDKKKPIKRTKLANSLLTFSIVLLPSSWTLEWIHGDSQRLALCVIEELATSPCLILRSRSRNQTYASLANWAVDCAHKHLDCRQCSQKFAIVRAQTNLRWARPMSRNAVAPMPA